MNANTDSKSETVHRFQHRAMATLFEVLIADEELKFAEGAARAVFEEIDRLEQELSRYLPNTDISRINNLSAGGNTRVGLDTFQCLRLSRQCWKETEGAFDVTLGGLMDCWVGKDKSLLHPSTSLLEQARQRTGMDLMELDEEAMTVRVGKSVPFVDLGAIGKGYAVDRSADLLKEWGITSALIHGGTSSVYAFGNHPGVRGWPVSLSHPGNASQVLETVQLKEQGLGGSGVRKGMHIIDPRKAEPVKGRPAAWFCCESAVRSDAISTAFMIMTHQEIENYISRNPGEWGMVVDEAGENEAAEVRRFGRSTTA